MASIGWSAEVDEIFAGDQAVMFAAVTPARGVVLSPLTNFGLRDRAHGTLSNLNSSVGMWKKLDRVRRNPQVAVAYHTREHGFSDRPEFVLVQGRATLTPPHTRYVYSSDAIRASFERFAGGNPRGGPLTSWWLRAWHERVGIEIDVERVIVWPDATCRGAAEVLGAPLPQEPPADQEPPAKGTAPRLDHRRAAHRAGRLPHVLLGWTGADGFPVVAPVRISGAGERGIALEAPPGLVPEGSRRAGLTAHRFSRYVIGQHQHVHTGWLSVAPGESPVYAPHTHWGYWFPRSRLAYKLAAGYGTRRGMREARRRGLVTG
jgi:hypothetical protein